MRNSKFISIFMMKVSRLLVLSFCLSALSGSAFGSKFSGASRNFKCYGDITNCPNCPDPFIIAGNNLTPGTENAEAFCISRHYCKSDEALSILKVLDYANYFQDSSFECIKCGKYDLPELTRDIGVTPGRQICKLDPMKANDCREDEQYALTRYGCTKCSEGKKGVQNTNDQWQSCQGACSNPGEVWKPGNYSHSGGCQVDRDTCNVLSKHYYEGGSCLACEPSSSEPVVGIYYKGDDKLCKRCSAEYDYVDQNGVCREEGGDVIVENPEACVENNEIQVTYKEKPCEHGVNKGKAECFLIKCATLDEIKNRNADTKSTGVGGTLITKVGESYRVEQPGNTCSTGCTEAELKANHPSITKVEPKVIDPQTIVPQSQCADKKGLELIEAVGGRDKWFDAGCVGLTGITMQVYSTEANEAERDSYIEQIEGRHPATGGDQPPTGGGSKGDTPSGKK